MDNSVQIIFGTPQHGWLPVDLRYKDFTLDIGASDVLNDPIEELYDTLIKLRDNKAGQITWWLEPGAYFFRFEKKDAQYILTISETDDLHNELGERRTTKIIAGDYKQIVAPFKKALVEFCSKTYEENHWPYNLDKFKVRQLTADT